MTDCIINLENLGIESRQQPVYYASGDFIVYQEGQYIDMANCSGDVVSRTRCPANTRQYEFLDIGDALLFIFGGKDLVLFDKFGEDPITRKLDVDQWGKIITKLYPSHNKNAVVFGTQIRGKVQFINYNFISDERISQSTSWDVRNIDDVAIKGDTLYAILNSSFLVACKIETCEMLWQRFEYSIINPKVIPHKGGLLYTCQNVVKFTDGEIAEPTKIPLVQISNLIGVRQNHLFFTSNKNQNVCAYNLIDKKLIWEITGQAELTDTLLCRGKSHYDIDEVLLAKTKNALSIVNLTRGRSTHHFKLPNVYKLRQTGDHILVHKYNRQTDMIPGVVKNEDDATS